MQLQKISVVVFCVFLFSHSTFAVINNANSVASVNVDINNSNSNVGSTSQDSVSVSSEKDVNRREFPVGDLSDSYGNPLPSKTYGIPFDTYGPPVPNKQKLPVPIYGVPDRPVKNIVYPAPPPDIPPPLTSLPITQVYVAAKPVYGPPLKLHPPTHHKPHFHKPLYANSFNYNSFKIPKPVYGPPLPTFIGKPQLGPVSKPVYGPPKLPKPVYGPPLKLNFISPKPVFAATKPIHGPIKLTGSFGGSLATYGPPHSVSVIPNFGSLNNNVYGPPKEVVNYHHPPVPVYDSLKPIPHGPPHPGAPAPPTPPDIKYDGWQPIFGLVSHPPNIYGTLHNRNQLSNGHNLTPSLTYASSFAHGSTNSLSEISHSPSDSYGAPLNTVTGSGGTVNLSGNDYNSLNHGTTGDSFKNSYHGNDNSLSVIKSIGYEILSNDKGQLSLDSYSTPPANSFSLDGPYPAALTQNHNSGIGLIPPSGVYGIPPGGQYDASLPLKNVEIPLNSYGPPASLNALDIKPPKSPVVFREPVPQGLIQSIGESVAHKDAQGIQHSHTKFHGEAYIPPPVPDITKQNDIVNSNINPLSNLYSLPSTGSPISFQSNNHGVGSSNLGLDFGTSLGHGSGIALTSYTAPLGVIDSSYGIPLQPQALTGDFNQFDFAKSTYSGAFTSSYAIPQISLQSTLPLPHDCSQYKSQPITSSGIPSGSASNYATSISSLNTNIGGQSNYNINTGSTDLQTVNSLQNSLTIQTDIPNNSLDIQGKSLGQQYFGKDTEFQQSQEIQIPNNIQNIPVQGSLGSYTLQIQSANGQSDIVPHEQVLSDGLLQSILSAIEQPENKPIEHNIQNYGDLHHEPSITSVSYQQNLPVEDGEAQHSVPRQVIITSPETEQPASTPKSVEETSTETNSETKQSLSLIDNNEIALYFNSNGGEGTQTQVSTSQNNKNDELSQEMRNGQQYGSFVSFKTPHSSYVYGEIKTNNETKAVTEKTY